MARGGYTLGQIKEMSDEEIYFIWHHQNQTTSEELDSVVTAIGLLFGVIWDKELDYTKSRGVSKSRYIATPLTMVVNPQYIQTVLGGAKKDGPKGRDIPAGAKSMAEMSTDEAQAFFRAAGIMKKKNLTPQT